MLAGKLDWFKITAASVHDRKDFPDIKSLANQLIIFDLGYWDYGLLISIAVAEGFFLSRVKSDAVFVIFNLDKRWLVSNNDNIIESLILSSIIASFATHVVL